MMDRKDIVCFLEYSQVQVLVVGESRKVLVFRDNTTSAKLDFEFYIGFCGLGKKFVCQCYF